jgi:integrase/recombinase XerC
MNPSHWIDTAASPPQPLPDSVDAALDYVAAATGHPVYTRWTLARLKRGCPSLADAKREHPTVFALLLEHAAAIEYWERGRLRIVAEEQAPAPDTVLTRVLHQHRRRFRELADGRTPGRADTSAVPAAPTSPVAPTAATSGASATAVWLAALEPSRTIDTDDPHAGTPACAATRVATSISSGGSWLARAGRFVNRSPVTNTLGAADDAQALVLFLRDRASRSPHTLRAYLADLRRLIAWCEREGLGPLSDLTRHDLLAYRREVENQPEPRVRHATGREGKRERGRATDEALSPASRQPARRDRTGRPHTQSAAVASRALAVISSLYRYWLSTGYLNANPAAGLSGGSTARSAWIPSRIMPARVIALCDAVVTGAPPTDLTPLVWARRCAIWALYRYGGVRLAELMWSDVTGLPRLEVDADGNWTLHVCGKGRKLRSVPLPAVCVPPLRAYRLARGLPAIPGPFERLPVIHSERRDALGASGLYDEVKAVFGAARKQVAPGEAATQALLRAASTHWLRHGYARTLVVDNKVPLPVAQQLLGHASVQTTAAYAKTDLTQTRAFVEGSFPGL